MISETRQITTIPGFKNPIKPIPIVIEEDCGYFTVVCKELGELAYGVTLEEALECFYDDVQTSYEAYVMCSIEELHETAYKVREIYKDYFGGDEK